MAGLGAGLLVNAPLVARQALVSRDDTASATATLRTMRNVGVSLSIVLGGVIFQNEMQLQSSKLRDHGLCSDMVKNLSKPDAATNINPIASIFSQAQGYTK